MLNENIPTNRVSPCIGHVLHFAGIEPNKLPSPTTIRTMNAQRLVLAQKQLQEFRDKENTTLETDETSKYGSKFGAYALRDETGRAYILGLRDLLTKSGQDTLNTLKEILWDIDQLYFNAANEDRPPSISDEILFHLRNTMSDRASTELKFNKLLELYRQRFCQKW